MKFIKTGDVRFSWHSQPYIQVRLAGEGLIRTGFDHIEIRIDIGQSHLTCLTLPINVSPTLLNSGQDDDLTWNIDPRGSLSRFEWKQTESWLQDCVDSHAICRIPNPRFVPKRLVQVIDSDSSLRLVERKDSEQRCVKYCALSYCWGPQGNALTTRKENLGEHLIGMSLSSMPQVSIAPILSVTSDTRLRY